MSGDIVYGGGVSPTLDFQPAHPCWGILIELPDEESGQVMEFMIATLHNHDETGARWGAAAFLERLGIDRGTITALSKCVHAQKSKGPTIVIERRRAPSNPRGTE